MAGLLLGSSLNARHANARQAIARQAGTASGACKAEARLAVEPDSSDRENGGLTSNNAREDRRTVAVTTAGQPSSASLTTQAEMLWWTRSHGRKSGGGVDG
jgi:hypothetical protein